jgi:hypothetical protein
VYRLGDVVQCVSTKYPEVYFEFGSITNIVPQTSVLTVSFKATLENYIEYALSPGDLLNVTTISWTGTNYYKQGIESLHAHARDPKLRRDRDWEILHEGIKEDQWFTDLTSQREAMQHQLMNYEIMKADYKRAIA